MSPPRPALALALLLLLAAGPARAQPAPPDSTASAGTRLIQISQINSEGALVGHPNELPCPPSGCQTVIDLMAEGFKEPFLFAVEFVGRGAYVTLSPRSIAIAKVQPWGDGHQGPIFVALSGAGRQQTDMPFIVIRAATLRALQPRDNPDVLASGNVFNRKRTPDMTLRVTFGPANG